MDEQHMNGIRCLQLPSSKPTTYYSQPILSTYNNYILLSYNFSFLFLYDCGVQVNFHAPELIPRDTATSHQQKVQITLSTKAR